MAPCPPPRRRRRPYNTRLFILLSPHLSQPISARQDAVRHVSRIHRVLGLKRGNLMLVGVGGSGRQSLTRLAAYISGQELFVIEIAKNYRQASHRFAHRLPAEVYTATGMRHHLCRTRLFDAPLK